MSQLRAAGDGLVDLLGTGLVHGTALALITALACATILRRTRPALRAALWGIVFLKFLVPVGPGWSISLSSALEGLWGSSPSAAAQPAAGPGALAEPATELASTDAPLSWMLVVVAGYAVIALLLLARTVVAARRTRRRLDVLEDAPADVVAEVARLAALVGVPAPKIVVTEGASAFVAGTWRPTLALPRWILRDWSTLRLAVVHELGHLGRRDPLWRWVEQVVGCIYFFWPPIRWIGRAAARSREMACDQWVIEHAEHGRRDYARLLLEVGRRSRQPTPGLAMAAPPSMLRARIETILAAPTPPRLGRRRAAAVVTWAVVSLAGAEAAGAHRASSTAPLCDVDPAIGARILASNPDADLDGDGSLSTAEVCAHQLRMKQRILDGVVDEELVSRIDPSADGDGDGVLSGDEIDRFKNRVGVAVEPAPSSIQLVIDDDRVKLESASLVVATTDVGAPICPQRQHCEDPTAGPGPESVLLIDVDINQE